MNNLKENKNEEIQNKIKNLAKEIASQTSYNFDEIFDKLKKRGFFFNFKRQSNTSLNPLDTGFMVESFSSFDSKVSEKNIKHGYTFFWNEKTYKLENFYKYVEGYLDLIDSGKFINESLSFNRQKECLNKNKKEKITDDYLKYRFYSKDLGFFSLKVLYDNLFKEANITLEDCQRYIMLPKRYGGKLFGRYCKSKMCACLGCDNIKFSNEEDFNKYQIFSRIEKLKK